MGDIVQIDVLDKAGHDDLIFCLKGLTPFLVFDTYYFAIVSEYDASFEDIKNCIATFLNHWIREIKRMRHGETRYFPIDFSDEYTGCLKVNKRALELEIAYGSSRRQGWTVNIHDPYSYFNNIDDFQSDTSRTIIVKQEGFIKSIKNQVDRLTK